MPKTVHDVVSADLEETALSHSNAKLPEVLKQKVAIKKVDLRQELPFPAESFDVVYAHLSLHYFDLASTKRIFQEIQRVLKPGGILAFFTNSVNDPQYKTGTKIEEDYYFVDDKPKRFLSVETARVFAKDFKPILLDDQGETYKDRAKGVHNLIRFIGSKPPQGA